MRVPLLITALALSSFPACGPDRAEGAGPGGQPTTSAAPATTAPMTTTPATTAPPTTAAAPTTAAPVPGSTTDAAPGVVAVRLEPVNGIFVEGFEVGLRFETAEGTVLASTLWSDFVRSHGDGTIDDHYTSVLEQPVPSGQIVVRATVNIGIGPAPEIPDLSEDLRCQLEVAVPPDGRVDVEVSFSGGPDCLRLG